MTLNLPDTDLGLSWMPQRGADLTEETQRTGHPVPHFNRWTAIQYA